MPLGSIYRFLPFGKEKPPVFLIVFFPLRLSAIVKPVRIPEPGIIYRRTPYRISFCNVREALVIFLAMPRMKTGSIPKEKLHSSFASL